MASVTCTCGVENEDRGLGTGLTLESKADLQGEEQRATGLGSITCTLCILQH